MRLASIAARSRHLQFMGIVQSHWSKELAAGEVVIVLQNIAKPYPINPNFRWRFSFANR